MSCEGGKPRLKGSEVEPEDGHPPLDLLCPLLDRDLLDISFPPQAHAPSSAESLEPSRSSAKGPSSNSYLHVALVIGSDLLHLASHGLPQELGSYGAPLLAMVHELLVHDLLGSCEPPDLLLPYATRASQLDAVELLKDLCAMLVPSPHLISSDIVDITDDEGHLSSELLAELLHVALILENHLQTTTSEGMRRRAGKAPWP